jgi:hypothetical protein
MAEKNPEEPVVPDETIVLPDGNVDVGEIQGDWPPSTALYTLESPARCPHCGKSIRTMRVVRIARTQASFTSPLPRSGRILVCPLCEVIISAELSGIL